MFIILELIKQENYNSLNYLTSEAFNIFIE